MMNTFFFIAFEGQCSGRPVVTFYIDAFIVIMD